MHSYSQSGDQSYSLRERVTQLEGLVKQVLDRLPENGPNQQQNVQRQNSGPQAGDTREAAEVLKNLRQNTANMPTEAAIVLPEGRTDEAPILSMFDNAVLKRQDSVVSTPSDPQVQNSKNKALIDHLKRLLPSSHDLEKILEASTDWWGIWRRMFPQICDPRVSTLREAVSHSLRSDKPAEVAKILLCIAISIDQLPTDFENIQLDLPLPRRNLMEQYIATVDKMITSDDEISATMDGVECMVLQAKYQINLGRPRRAWILMRRAVGFAQMLGLHRSFTTPKAEKTFEVQRQQSLWFHLCQNDNYLALLLGLPYSIDQKFCQPPRDLLESKTTGEGEGFLLRVTPIIAKIVDRNQSPQKMPYSTTLNIDAELEELKTSLSRTFSPINEDGVTLNEFYDRLIAQFIYNQIRQLLHLPFMLKSTSDTKYKHSYNAALDSSRQMIMLYRDLRSDHPVGPFICKLIDFQAFTASMLILLNNLGYSQNQADMSSDAETSDQENRDWELVYHTISILNRCSSEAGGIVAAQSAKALKMFAKARHGCDNEDKDGDTAKVVIPYFGTITIGAGRNFKMPKTATTSGSKFVSMTSPAQLPTPPCSFGTAHSVGGSSVSAQMSPANSSSTNIDPALQQVPPHQYNSSGLLVPEQTHIVYSESDPYVAFDSFQAALPGADQIDSMAPMDGMSSASVPPADGTNWSYLMGMGNMDLDQGWDWYGNLGGSGNDALAPPGIGQAPAQGGHQQWVSGAQYQPGMVGLH